MLTVGITSLKRIKQKRSAEGGYPTFFVLRQVSTHKKLVAQKNKIKSPAEMRGVTHVVPEILRPQAGHPEVMRVLDHFTKCC